ncbi:hypothetical protein HDU98_000939 [Podochytrium sp. JEL0797]|nr:hypothetical protein HDU98_000939 [Podochytrium sp. JEL0797]
MDISQPSSPRATPSTTTAQNTPLHEQDAPTVSALEKIGRLVHAQMVFHLSKLQQQPEATATPLQHADVQRLLELTIVGVQGGVRVLKKERPETGCHVGTALWPVAGKFAVSVRVEVKV